jgi:hypothetical protein
MKRLPAVAMTVLCIGFLGILSGCGPSVRVKEQINLVDVNHDAVDHLMRQAWLRLGSDSRVIAATFVSLDDLTLASPFGRVVGEMCAAKMTQKGYRMISMKLRRSVVISREGEFLLSRDMKEVAQNYQARAILVGTYTATQVGSNIRSLNQQWESADPLLKPHPADGVSPSSRNLVIVNDYVYVSLRLISAEDGSILGAHDYRIPVDENVQALLYGSAPEQRWKSE